MAIKDRLYGIPVLGTALRVQDRYKADAGNQLAAALGFFGFLSLFPVMLLALSIAGYVLAGDPTAQADIVRSIEQAVPGLAAAGGGNGQTVIGQAMDSITQNPGTVGLVGLVTLLLAGLRVVDSAMTATERVFRVTVEQSAVRVKVRQVAALAGLGLLALAGTVAAASVGALAQGLGAALSVLAVVVVPLVALVLDLLLFLVAYRVLAAGQGPSWRELLPGATLAAVGWTGLKLFGSTYVASQVAKTNELYGTLGGVIGLLLLLFLAGRLYLYGAELSAVLCAPGADLVRRDPDVEPSRDGQESPVDEPVSETHADVPLPGPGAPPSAQPTDTPDRLRTPPAPALAPPPPPEQPSPSVSAATAARLAASDQRNAAGRDPNYVRKAIAFVIALGAVGGLVQVMRPGGDERP